MDRISDEHLAELISNASHMIGESGTIRESVLTPILLELQAFRSMPSDPLKGIYYCQDCGGIGFADVSGDFRCPACEDILPVRHADIDALRDENRRLKAALLRRIIAEKHLTATARMTADDREELLANEMDRPHFTTNDSGEAVFEWWNDPRKITVYVSDNSVEFVKVWGADVDSEMSEGVATTARDVFDLFMWLNNG